MHAAPYLAAFKRLHTSRIIGDEGVPSGIAMSEIESYCRMFGFDSLEDRFDLMHYIKFCDSIFLEEVGKKRSARAKQRPTSGGRQPRRGTRG